MISNRARLLDVIAEAIYSVDPAVAHDRGGRRPTLRDLSLAEASVEAPAVADRIRREAAAVLAALEADGMIVFVEGAESASAGSVSNGSGGLPPSPEAGQGRQPPRSCRAADLPPPSPAKGEGEKGGGDPI